MTIRFCLRDIAEYIGAELDGDGDCEITKINTVQDAKAGELSFLANQAYRHYLADSEAGAVILSEASRPLFNGNALVMANPYLGYALASKLFNNAPKPKGSIHPNAIVAASAKVASTATIAPNAVIGEHATVGDNSCVGAGTVVGDDSVIGENCSIAANVSIYHNVSVGNNVIIHSGAVIGADGFGFARHDGAWIKIYQLGGVVIGNNVEIGACTTIDRGALGDTVIADGAILDNHVQIAHNVKLGENTAMAGFSGVAGSTTVGKNCTFAGRAGVVGHVSLCDGIHLTTGTSVTKTLTEPGNYSAGTVFSKTKDWKKNAVRFNQLDDIAHRLKTIEKKLEK